MEVAFHIVLQTPTAGVDFGLQKGSGSSYTPVQIQRSVANDLQFYFTAIVKGDRLKDALPKFSGPFVQGPYPNNFIYIDIGTLAGQPATAHGFTRRLKIPLAGITWLTIDQLNADPQLILQTHVPGRAKDGTPNCATVKPFGGWQIIKEAT